MARASILLSEWSTTIWAGLRWEFKRSSGLQSDGLVSFGKFKWSQAWRASGLYSHMGSMEI